MVPRHPGTHPEVRYLDPPNILKRPSKEVFWMLRGYNHAGKHPCIQQEAPLLYDLGFNQRFQRPRNPAPRPPVASIEMFLCETNPDNGHALAVKINSSPLKMISKDHLSVTFLFRVFCCSNL